MKRRSVIQKIICVIFLVLFGMMTRANAASDQFQATLKVDSQAERKATVTVTIGISNLSIASGEKGIGAYTAKIEFDEDVLEYVSTQGTANWESPLFNDGFIIGNTTTGEVVKSTQSIGSITFRVKENAKLGNTAIRLTNFIGSTGITDVPSSGNKSANVKILEIPKQTEEPKQENKPTQNNKPSPNHKGNQNNKPNQGNKGEINPVSNQEQVKELENESQGNGISQINNTTKQEEYEDAIKIEKPSQEEKNVGIFQGLLENKIVRYGIFIVVIGGIASIILWIEKKTK